MTDALRRLLMLGVGSAAILCAAADDAGAGDGEPMGIIELEGNLADAEKPPELRSGRYIAEVQGVEEKISAAGNKYYAIKMVIPTEELPADVKEDYEDGAVLYWNRQLVPVPGKMDRRTLFSLRKLIEAIGLDSNTTQVNPDEWMGCRCRLHIVQENWQGEMRAQIRAVEAVEGERAPAANTNARGGKGKGQAKEAPAPRGRQAARGRGR